MCSYVFKELFSKKPKQYPNATVRFKVIDNIEIYANCLVENYGQISVLKKSPIDVYLCNSYEEVNIVRNPTMHNDKEYYFEPTAEYSLGYDCMWVASPAQGYFCQPNYQFFKNYRLLCDMKYPSGLMQAISVSPETLIKVPENIAYKRFGNLCYATKGSYLDITNPQNIMVVPPQVFSENYIASDNNQTNTF
jgi:hypothetical protein